MTGPRAAFVLRRVLATLVDDALVAAPLGATLIVNLAAARRGRRLPLRLTGRIRLWVPCCVTLPASLALGVAEHYGGSIGKRALGLQLRPADLRPPRPEVPWRRAMVRSLLKTGLPWELGHQSVWQLRADKNISGGLLGAAAYALVIAQLVAAVRGDGRTYADQLGHSVVTD